MRIGSISSSFSAKRSNAVITPELAGSGPAVASLQGWGTEFGVNRPFKLAIPYA